MQSFKFNKNIIEQNIENAYLRKRKLKTAYPMAESEAPEKLYYLNYATGKYSEFVEEAEREKLHQFLSSPILNLRPRNEKPVVLADYKEYKEVRGSFIRNLRAGSSPRPDTEFRATPRITRPIEFTERDRRLLEEESRLYLPRRVQQTKFDLKRQLGSTIRLRIIRDLNHVKTSYLRFCMHGKGVSIMEMFPVGPLQHPFASSFFQLIHLSKRNFESTRRLLLAFIKNNP